MTAMAAVASQAAINQNFNRLLDNEGGRVHGGFMPLLGRASLVVFATAFTFVSAHLV